MKSVVIFAADPELGDAVAELLRSKRVKVRFLDLLAYSGEHEGAMHVVVATAKQLEHPTAKRAAAEHDAKVITVDKTADPTQIAKAVHQMAITPEDVERTPAKEGKGRKQADPPLPPPDPGAAVEQKA